MTASGDGPAMGSAVSGRRGRTVRPRLTATKCGQRLGGRTARSWIARIAKVAGTVGRLLATSATEERTVRRLSALSDEGIGSVRWSLELAKALIQTVEWLLELAKAPIQTVEWLFEIRKRLRLTLARLFETRARLGASVTGLLGMAEALAASIARGCGDGCSGLDDGRPMIRRFGGRRDGKWTDGRAGRRVALARVDRWSSGAGGCLGDGGPMGEDPGA